jgi:AAA+ ATPase superfamily predicted ATPase
VIRNQILEAQRLRSSDIGNAKAVQLKKIGLTLSELTEKYSQLKFGKSFTNLSAVNKNKVYLEIIESAGRQRPSVNVAAMKYSKLGRGLLIVTLGVAIYNIIVAEDKAKATAREGVIIGGGFAGGAAGGAVAGLSCGPGAPVCVTIGVFVGGALGALGADFTFGWFF